MTATMVDVFGQASAFRVPRSRNFVLVARNGGRLDRGALARVRTENKELRRILEECQQAGSWLDYPDVPSKSLAGRVTLDDDQPSLAIGRIPFLLGVPRCQIWLLNMQAPPALVNRLTAPCPSNVGLS